ncbi:MAG: RluA family pseudouridine synthase [Phycisphaeraceae bacterium]
MPALTPAQPDDHDPDLAIDAEDEQPLGDEAVESDGAQHRRFRLHRDLRKRLDRYLRDRLPALSRSRLQKLINEGAVTVNDRQPKSSTQLRVGDVVDVVVPPPPIKQIPAEDIPIDVLYEDEHLIVLNKQPDLVVHPARSNMHGTMVNALAWYFRHIEANGLEALSKVGVDEFRPGIVHRLDKDTTGAIVVAKTDEAHWRLNRQFERRQVQKYYLALVHGEMKPPGDVIDAPIGKHPAVAEAYAVRHDNNGRDAITLYRVREVFDGYSLVELELKTGRTHQIRVHLTWLGHPIVSDIIYGGEPLGEPEFHQPVQPTGGKTMLTYARQKMEGVKIWQRMAERDDLLIARPALHATILQFTQPITGEPIRITAPMYPDMAALIRRLRTERPKSGPLPAEGAMVDMDAVLGEA